MLRYINLYIIYLFLYINRPSLSKAKINRNLLMDSKYVTSMTPVVKVLTAAHLLAYNACQRLTPCHLRLNKNKINKNCFASLI